MILAGQIFRLIQRLADAVLLAQPLGQVDPLATERAERAVRHIFQPYVTDMPATCWANQTRHPHTAYRSPSDNRTTTIQSRSAMKSSPTIASVAYSVLPAESLLPDERLGASLAFLSPEEEACSALAASLYDELR